MAGTPETLEKVEVTGVRFQTDLDRALSRPDPLLNIEWDIMLRVSGLKFNIGDYIEEVQLPTVKIDTKQVFRQGIFLNYAKTESTGSLTFKAYETHKATAYRFFRAWKNLVRDPQGNYGSPDKYKGTVFLYPHSPMRTEEVVFECRGVFPTSLPGYGFGSGSPERIVGDFEFSVDEIIPLAVDSPTT